MTEHEWLNSTNPEPMWRYLESSNRVAMARRQTKLLACAFVRWGWTDLDDQGRRITESVERYAEGCERVEHLRRAMEGYFEKVEAQPDRYKYNATGLWSARRDDYLVRFAVEQGIAALAFRRQSDEVWKATHIPEICETIRCIFGNPFRPTMVGAPWRTRAALELAAGIL